MNLEQLQNEACERFEKKFACVKETDSYHYNPWFHEVKYFWKQEIKNAIQTAQQGIIKMLKNNDVQMSVNGSVSQDEIAMAKFLYKAHIKHIIKKIESATIPPNSINGTLPSETDSATK